MLARRLLPALLAAVLAACGDAPKVSPPVLALSPSSLSFAGAAGGASPAAQQVTVSNAGGGTLGAPTVELRYASGSGWLAATVTGSAAPYTVTVQATQAGLAAGSYAATLRLASVSAANPALSVAVTLTVSAAQVPSAMALSPAALELRAAAPGADPASQAVAVTATGTVALVKPVATVRYLAAGAPDWLVATVVGDAAPFTVTVQATTAALALGIHQATVELASAGATNTPATIPVTLFLGRTVDVARHLTTWGEDGDVAAAADTSVAAVALLQDDGAGGLARTAAVQSLSAGIWTAVAAPGSYLAEVTFEDGRLVYAQASADELDLGADRAGRADLTAATEPTEVTFLLTELFPWGTFNSIRGVSWGAQSITEWFPQLSLGATDTIPEFDPFIVDWAEAPGTLLVAGDVLHLLQYDFVVSEPSGELSYQEVMSATSATGLMLASGTPATVEPLASQATVLSSMSAAWGCAAMEAASAPFTASASGMAHRLGVYAIPAPLTAPSPVGAVAIPVFEALDAANRPDVQSDSATFGRWLPSTWSEYREVAFTTPAPRTAPGAAGPAILTQRVLHQEVMPAAGVAGPLVGVVQAPLVGGLDALVPQAGLATPLTLAWAAPALGEPTSYRVAIHELTAQGGATASREVAAFWLPASATSLGLPAGLLLPAHAYAALITARTSPADAGGASPLRVGLPYGEASLWTEVFTTAP